MIQVLKDFLKVQNHDQPISFKVVDEVSFDLFNRQLIEFELEDGDIIPAFLFLPNRVGECPAVLVHHQHNGERHLGKSEVAGIKGNPLQAFGPILAQKGFVVLAPDSICFEDRRKNKRGTEPDIDERDWTQHFNEMTYRLVKGDALMRKVLGDASSGLSLLYHHPKVEKARIGVLGHSYGGNTALFQAAIDDRIRFACTSGAVCSYKNKMESGTSFEFSLAIPRFCEEFDFEDLLSSVAPRKIFVLSATEDKYSKDADLVVEKAQSAFEELEVSSNLYHKRYYGGHALTEERFRDIVEWICLQ